MNIAEHFPIYNELTPEEQRLIDNSAFSRDIKKGTLIHNDNSECLGLTIITDGQLRAYKTSEDGREITLFRLLEYDICLFSTSCTMQSFRADVTIVAEKDSTVIVIPAHVYEQLAATSIKLVTYASEVMANHFSDVMWLLEQIMWKSFDKRLAAFLVEESYLENSTTLKITHELIANHLGTAREVVTRMLKYFQNEEYINLTRGTIDIIDLPKLKNY
ncbi:MAG: Crp/Fnr family transcriptional regulator [Lachnospiraceae bacterium]|nr:Crp/Fnr family transcriptional regulator [Lachnospiraceae bacterium]